MSFSFGRALRLAVVLLVLAAFSGKAFPASNPELRVGIFPAAPLVFESAGKPTGLFIELLEEVARKKGWKLVFVPGTWNEHLAALERGDLDLLPAVGYTTERALHYDFSHDPVFIDSGVLFTTPGAAPRSIFELQGKRVAAVRGSVFTNGFQAYLESFGLSCDLVDKDDNPSVMDAIVRREVDAGVCIYSLGMELAKHYPVAVTAISFSPVALEFAAPKGRQAATLAAIDAAMQGWLADNESYYTAALARWTRFPEPYRFPEWLAWALAGIGILAAVLAAWSLTLRRQVALRTADLRQEIAVRSEAETRLKRSLEEKNILIRELFHRTKNSLQVVDAILRLKAGEFPDNVELQALVDGANGKIQAMSLVHQMLYESNDLSRISIGPYSRRLVEELRSGNPDLSNRIAFDLDFEEAEVLLDAASPFGIVLCELLMNSMHHAFPDGREGRVRISLARINGRIFRLFYEDDGVGVPDGFDFRGQATLGMNLIFQVAERQLAATVMFEGGSGRRGLACRIDLDLAGCEARV